MFGLDFPTFIARAVTLVIAFTIHEFAHAWTATQLGDDTPRLMGRLTLNPLAHLDLMGSLLLLLAGFGWAKPVPVNPYRLRYGSRTGMMIVAAAGPFSNFLMALVAAIPFRRGAFSALSGVSGPAAGVSFFLSAFIWINLILLVFNMIPLPPLDGSKVLKGLFQRGEVADLLDRLEPWGPFVLLLLILGSGYFDLLGLLIVPPARLLFGAMVG